METLKLLTELHARVTREMSNAHGFYLEASPETANEGYFDGKEVAYSHVASMLEGLIEELKPAEGLTAARKEGKMGS